MDKVLSVWRFLSTTTSTGTNKTKIAVNGNTFIDSGNSTTSMAADTTTIAANSTTSIYTGSITTWTDN